MPSPQVAAVVHRYTLEVHAIEARQAHQRAHPQEALRILGEHVHRAVFQAL
ncbi:MAG: hypothetical protein JNK75_10230, partial [Betaproteobacteria bacterium]|nr:hypothetical protein [Betaproteobacteria bacterium]